MRVQAQEIRANAICSWIVSANEERITITIDSAPSQPTALKVRVPYWATKGVTVAINGETQSVNAMPSKYVMLEHPWKAGDVVIIDMPLSPHINTTNDDKKVQAAMYGPLVLAVQLNTEGLTNSMIYGGSGPRGYDDRYSMPTVDTRPPRRGPNAQTAEAVAPGDIWFERIEGTRHYPFQFRTKGRGPLHTLVPLSQIMDERYSVYIHNDGVA